MLNKVNRPVGFDFQNLNFKKLSLRQENQKMCMSVLHDLNTQISQIVGTVFAKSPQMLRNCMHALSTVKPETLASGNFDEFGESE